MNSYWYDNYFLKLRKIKDEIRVEASKGMMYQIGLGLSGLLVLDGIFCEPQAYSQVFMVGEISLGLFGMVTSFKFAKDTHKRIKTLESKCDSLFSNLT